MNRHEKLEAIYKAVDKKQNEIILRRSAAYMKPLKDKVWAKTAEKYLAEFTAVIDEILKAQQAAYVKLVEDAPVLYKGTEGIKKANRKYRTEEYLDEKFNRIVVNDVKDSLVDMGKKFEKILAESYEKFITNGLVRESAELVYKDLGVNFEFNKFNEKTRKYLNDKKIKWAKQVEETTEKEVKRIVTDDYEQGKSTYETADSVRSSSGFKFGRSEAIARTEIVSACNYTDYVGSLDADFIIGNEWSAADGRTRPTHRAADGQKRNKYKPFNVGGSKLLFPGDNSLGAAAREVINCRCTLFHVFEGESMESKTVYDEEGVGTDAWLRRQNESFQNEYMGGKAKGALFRNGSISVGDKETAIGEISKELQRKAIENIVKMKGITPVGISQADYLANILPSILAVQTMGIRNDKEYAKVVDYQTGEAFTEGIFKDIIKGKESSVSPNEKQLKELTDGEKDKYILIHNHPNGGTFSINDVIAFVNWNAVKAMIVVGNNGLMYYLSGDTDWGVPDGVNESELKKFIAVAKKEITNDVWAVYTERHSKDNVKQNQEEKKKELLQTYEEQLGIYLQKKKLIYKSEVK